MLGRFGVVYLFLILLIMKWRSYRPGKFALSILGLEGCFFFSTLYNGSYSLRAFCLNEITTLVFVFFIDYEGNNREIMRKKIGDSRYARAA